MKKLIAGILIFIGLFFLLGFVVNMSEEGATVTLADWIALLLLVGTPLAGGGLLLKSHYGHNRKLRQHAQKTVYQKQEREILRLAQQKGGRLTIPEIAVDTSMSTAEAEEFMQGLAAKGYVDMQVTDSGVIVYEFYDLIHKNSSLSD
ncbi:hypothetical protein GF339_12340 [candidate division KSB3 bacterium]|uniref:Uncharacterized protein n=1 Tax=candidate division KSB3 bacterium TaxID=2044937 RepID=A0A9D5JWF5_9BACT|nr:hypothetical protein [candidate division KSB3 bacterium]MBD3325370.1 hypothetical protein [candidate division KSB3 bacterium]